MKRIEIKIVVDENQKEDLKRFISDCKKHGFEVTREGGGRLPNWSGWYASLEGENWCPLPDVEEKSNWISASIYPDRQGSYLCFMDNCYVKMCFWNESEWLDMWQSDLKGTVLYWMKLPEAP